jgi:Putative peptidoglycan binding domain
MPANLRTLLRFQAAKGLEPSGEVDAATLGRLAS